jgi:hypothetical protein
MPAADSRLGLTAGACLIAVLLATHPIAVQAQGDEYVWFGGETEAWFVSLTYGSPESPEDILFWVFCDNKKQTTELTLYVTVDESRVGQKVALEFSAGNAKTSIAGKFSSDELNGPFAEGKNFRVKPLLETFKAKGPITVKTAEVVTTLPEDGRAEAVSQFAKACKLD